MKNYLVFALPLTLTLTSGLLYGQAKTSVDPFPTYQQIKPSDSEIIDYVPQQGMSGLVNQKIVFKLFDYPENTVTHILNGKATTDGKYAKELLSRKEIHIDKITIERPTSDGKQTIQLNYSTKQ